MTEIAKELPETQIAIVQLPNETVALTGFRYTVIISRVDFIRAFAFPSIYKMTEGLHSSEFGDERWAEIEGDLAKRGAWKIVTKDPILLGAVRL